MKRYILRYRGEGNMPPTAVAQVNALPKARIVDQSSRMLLVEAADNSLSRLVKTLSDWSCTPEKLIKLPRTKPNLNL